MLPVGDILFFVFFSSTGFGGSLKAVYIARVKTLLINGVEVVTIISSFLLFVLMFQQA